MAPSKQCLCIEGHIYSLFMSYTWKKKKKSNKNYIFMACQLFSPQVVYLTQTKKLLEFIGKDVPLTRDPAKQVNLQNEKSCHFSKFWHFQRLLGQGLPEWFDLPGFPTRQKIKSYRNTIHVCRSLASYTNYTWRCCNCWNALWGQGLTLSVRTATPF